MTFEEFEACLSRAVCDKDLAVADIPAIDLYVDQILSLVSSCNADAAPRYRERELTKTMINNYSKDGLISPIDGKKYSRDHIIEILLVYALKNTLSIADIKRVLTGARNGCGFSGKDLIEEYTRFLAAKETNRTRAPEAVRELLRSEGLDMGNDRDFFAALLNILSFSAYLKTIAQELLEARYEDPDHAEKERKERERVEKKEREEKEKTERREREEREKAAKKVEKGAEKKKNSTEPEPAKDAEKA